MLDTGRFDAGRTSPGAAVQLVPGAGMWGYRKARFEHAAERIPQPLLHTWSLVDEQGVVPRSVSPPAAQFSVDPRGSFPA